MKVAVINFSGNVGKTTIARHLLAARMNNAQVIAVESINSDGQNGEAMRGKQFGELQLLLQTTTHLVVDIGASNVEDLLKTMTQHKGSQDDFDYFVVPVVPSAKQQRDTIGTIDALTMLNVPAGKVRVLFNQVELGDPVERIFAGIFNYADTEKRCTIPEGAVLHVNELYPQLARSTVSVDDILADKTDYKAKIAATSNKAEQLRLAQLVVLRRLAVGVKDELDSVFTALFQDDVPTDKADSKTKIAATTEKTEQP